MGITIFEKELLNDIIETYRPETVLEFGSQNDYSTDEQSKPPFMSKWYEQKGIQYISMDLAGDNNSLQVDFSVPVTLKLKFDLVTDFGTSEHCVKSNDYEKVSFNEHIHSVYPKEVVDVEQAYYNCWLNKHNLLKEGGIIVNVNPLTNNWGGHGYSYINEQFYEKLSEYSDYKILKLGLHAAMGNTKDGWNVFCVLQKCSDIFPSFYEFSKFPIFKK